MKYNTFRGLLVGGAVLLVLGALGTCVVLVVRRAEPEPIARPTPIGLPDPIPLGPTATVAPAAPEPDPSTSTELPLRPMDRELLELAKRPIAGDKVKDAFPRARHKVNLYKDAGQTQVNRAKLDLDRDEKWDEKWTFEGAGKVKRQIAPNDDEQYSLEFRLEGERWVKKG